MRLTKKEFLEIYHEIEKAEQEQAKMQEAIQTMCEASFPIIKDPYEPVFYKLMKMLLNDEYFDETVYGSCSKGYIGDTVYDFSKPEEYYDFLSEMEKEVKKNKKEQKVKK